MALFIIYNIRYALIFMLEIRTANQGWGESEEKLHLDLCVDVTLENT